jgi:23S rRNA pseudouridine1911/1915/1917 synthase
MEHSPINNSGFVYRNLFHDEKPMTVLEFYVKHYKHSASDCWKQRILDGQITLDGLTVLDENQVMQKGQVLCYHRKSWTEPIIPIVKKFIDILYEDAFVVVLSKPSGLPVLPSGNYMENTLLFHLRRHYNERSMPQVAAELAPIHRLGRGTSGCILFSKNKQVSSFLGKALRNHELLKTYICLVEGTSMPDEYSINQPIGLVSFPRITHTETIHAASDHGKFALSKFRVLYRDMTREQSLLLVNLITGRPHQIRIHTAFAGFPLVGDPLYVLGGIPRPDGQAVPGDCGYALHSWRIGFPHPDGSRRMIMVESKLPKELQFSFQNDRHIEFCDCNDLGREDCDLNWTITNNIEEERTID